MKMNLKLLVYGYSIELKREAKNTLDNLMEEVNRWGFPLNNQMASLLS